MTCESGKIINPETGRCVSRTGKIGLKILAQRCTKKQIINPETGRCVLKDGRIGRRLLQKSPKRKSPRKTKASTKRKSPKKKKASVKRKSPRKSPKKKVSAKRKSPRRSPKKSSGKHGLVCNKPAKSWRAGKKRVVRVCRGGREKIVHYGATGYKHNYSAAAKRSFRARHKCDEKKDPFTAGYWACNDLWPA